MWGCGRTPISSPSTCPGASAAFPGYEGGGVTVGKRRTRPAGRRRQIRPGSVPPKEPLFFCAEGQTEERYVRALVQYRYGGLFVPQPLGPRSRRPGRETSLKNLIDHARNEETGWRRSERGKTIWIVCDADANELHRDALERWLDEENHRCAMQAVSIEAWLLQHFADATRPLTAGEAFSRLQKQWPEYVKGRDIPKWLIERTDEACKRERDFLRGVANAGAWPVERSSQLPALIAYLDERKRKLDERKRELQR
ncbi:RloB domain-containing protein [Actinomyces procaprae]|uniref:RloB domain-containing protein n=1 Tax=Actinomyces procaprae TaxID=2560010 RepID=UPI001FFA4AF4|nr:RloB domain-containing protein [Actinomyces procaprae]